MQFCVPVDENGLGVKNASRHLTCYRVKPVRARCTAEAPANAGARCSGERDCGGTPHATALCVPEPGDRPVRGVHVNNELGPRALDVRRAHVLCLPSRRNPPRPVQEDLTPCPATDEWSFTARAGQTVTVRLDTVDPGTASEMSLGVFCPGPPPVVPAVTLTPCSFSPRGFACLQATFVATVDTTCTLFVRPSDFDMCARPDTARYQLTVAADGEDVGTLRLVVDDRPPGG